jgi:hypothetical protein
MSDFLDRLAARAIGSDATLAPRLPSLFEPLPRAPLMTMADEGEASARVRDAGPMPPAAAAAVPPPRPPLPAHGSIEPRTARTTPAEQVPLRLPERAPTMAPPVPVPPSRAATPARAMIAEPSRATSVPEHAQATPPPVAPRASRPSRHEAAHPPTAVGALLPAPAPVFATTSGPAAPAQHGRAAALRHPRDMQAGRESRTSGEPVVHVSIGRLEVRAAPAAAAPPRRRDGPQPSSLDDYLRQRGKVSP